MLTNQLFLRYSRNKLHIALNAHYNYSTQKMNSALLPNESYNDVNLKLSEFCFGPAIRYNFNNTFNIETQLLANSMSVDIIDNMSNNQSQNRIFLHPVISVNGNISNSLKYGVNASYYEYSGDLFDIYSNKIMSNYREISFQTCKMPITQRQDYRLYINYTNIPSFLFFSIEADYWNADKNLTYAIYHDQNYSSSKAVDTPSSSRGHYISTSLNKYLHQISTSFQIGAIYSSSFNEVIRQENKLIVNDRQMEYKVAISSRITRWLNFDYEAKMVNSDVKIQKHENTSTINYFTQKSEVLFNFGKNMNLAVNGYHFSCQATDRKSTSSLFVGAQLLYKLETVEFSLEARNILGNNHYNSTSITDITTHLYSFELRPRTFILKVKFNIL